MTEAIEAFNKDGELIDIPTAVDFAALSPAADALPDLKEETREWLTKRHVKEEGKGFNLNDLIQQAHTSDQFAGGAVAVPKDDATDEEMNTFYKRLGRPEEAAKYDFKVPDKMPDNLPYDQKAADWFRTQAFTTGLTQRQATSMHDAFVSYQAENGVDVQKALGADVTKLLETSEATLVKAWGDREGETFKKNVELAGRALDEFDPKDELKTDLTKAGLIGPGGEVLVPSLAIMFARLGTAMLVEDPGLLEGSGGPLTGDNPFAKDTFNLTKIMLLVKSDRDKARTMAIAAGANLKEYAL